MHGEIYHINRGIIVATRNNERTFSATLPQAGEDDSGNFYHVITRPVPEKVLMSALVFPTTNGSIDFSADNLIVNNGRPEESQGSVYFSNSNEVGGTVSFSDYAIGADGIPILVKLSARYNGIGDKEPETPKPPKLEYSFDISSLTHTARIINPNNVSQQPVNLDSIFQNPGQIVTISDSNPGSGFSYTLEVGNHNGIDCLIQTTLEVKGGTEVAEWQEQRMSTDQAISGSQAKPIITRVIPLWLPANQIFNPDPSQISLANTDIHGPLSRLSPEALRNEYETFLANLIHPIVFFYD